MNTTSRSSPPGEGAGSVSLAATTLRTFTVPCTAQGTLSKNKHAQQQQQIVQFSLEWFADHSLLYLYHRAAVQRHIPHRQYLHRWHPSACTSHAVTPSRSRYTGHVWCAPASSACAATAARSAPSAAPPPDTIHLFVVCNNCVS